MTIVLPEVRPCGTCGARDRFPSGGCRPCIKRRNATPERVKYRREWARQWRMANPDEARAKEKNHRDREPAESKAARQAKYYAENRDYWRTWQVANRDSTRAAQRRWRAANPEASRAATNRWRAANWPMVLASLQRRRGRRRGAKGSFTAAQVRARFDYYGGLCWICRSTTATCVDHVIALCNGGTNYPSNLRPACGPCNSAKGAWEMTGPKQIEQILTWAKIKRRAFPPPL